MELQIYQIDAFADKVFNGNPAAVCVLTEWLPDASMQQIAMENNLAETAFVCKKNEQYEIRWFTPTVEVDLCGHATLASAYVLFHFYGHSGSNLILHSPRSGQLSVNRDNELLTLNFPVDEIHQTADVPELNAAIGMQPLETYKGKTDYVLIFEKEADVVNISPDIRKLSQIAARGIIVTAPGDHCDFVSRFFGPRVGVDEDPVTGSAHTSLTPIWTQKLGRSILSARQLSKRGGELKCELKKDRVLISGTAVLYLKGSIYF